MINLFEEFGELKKLLCICPCCGEIVRVSDLHLKTKEVIAKTWLDEYESKVRGLLKKEEGFAEKESKLRATAVEKGRVAAEVAFNKAISPKLQALKLDPYDVKPILNPIDFLVFKGMSKEDSISEIMLLSSYVKNPGLNLIRKQVEKVISQKNYEWKVARIGEEGNIAFE